MGLGMELWSELGQHIGVEELDGAGDWAGDQAKD